MRARLVIVMRNVMACGVLLLAGCATVLNNTQCEWRVPYLPGQSVDRCTISAPIPFVELPVNETPERYLAKLQIVDDPNEVCQRFTPLAGSTYSACTLIGPNQIFMPDPCNYTDESYARLLCHEGFHITHGQWHD